MTQKAEFSAEEWSLILEAAPTAAMIIVASNKGGSIRESLSVGKSYKAEQQNADQTELLAAIVADRPQLDPKRYSTPDELQTAGLQRVRGAVDTVEAKATTVELGDFRRFIYDVARNTAEAHKEGGFLGIGGTKISESEAEALQRLADTIGYQAPPLEPTAES
jgi:hypothetical protein